MKSDILARSVTRNVEKSLKRKNTLTRKRSFDEEEEKMELEQASLFDALGMTSDSQILDLFPDFNEVRVKEYQNLLNVHKLNVAESKQVLSAGKKQRNIPMFRYIPSRLIL